VIVPDVNILVYAHNESSRFHTSAFAWWEEALNDDTTILLPNICINGFVRIMTHPKILIEPLDVSEAFEQVESWLESESLSLLAPGPRHLDIYKEVLLEAGVGGKLTTDAYIAAMAIENQATVYSNDSDFGRFSGLRWSNPLLGN
jgi:toxin-antitoxin system PIN domain toxin